MQRWRRGLALAAFALLAAAPARGAAPDPQIQREFVEGAQLLEAGDHAAAARVFRALLARTDSPRIRLELARALYHLGEYRESRALFGEVLLDPEVPWQVRDNVEVFVRAIDEIEGYVRFSASIVSDTNPRNITGQREFTIGGIGLTFEPPPDSERVTGLRYSVEAYQPILRERRFGAYLTGSYLDYAGSRLDRLTLDGGLIKAFGPEGATRLRGGVEVGTFGGRRLYEFPYIGAGQMLFRGPWYRVDGELKLGRANFPDFGHLDARYASVALAGSAALTQNVAVSMGGTLERSSAREAPYSYYGGRIEPGVSWLIPRPALLVRANLGLGQRDYEALDPFFGEQRRDRLTRLELSVRSKQWRIVNRSPAAVISFERARSNIEFYTYEKVNFAIVLE
jgi:hypothetical protein